MGYAYWPKNLGRVDPDDIPRYPCQCCHKGFDTRSSLATHPCDPYGRNPKPERGRVKRNRTLEDHRVRELREQYAAGNKSQTQLAEEYGITRGVVGSIVLRRTYADV